ncbi:hypothetical protein ACFVJ4_42680 [Streptomyces sp. NPDC127178]|uniref:hypothetical protein n=1 Tax=unclassified Streptomyces TaxID=2593676 RepID=UPI0036438B0F
MTDRDVIGFGACLLIGVIISLIWSTGGVGRPASIVVGAVLIGYLYDWWEEPDHGPKRPVLTILAEIFGIVGGVVALIQFIQN